jgi:hypothetical protein
VRLAPLLVQSICDVGGNRPGVPELQLQSRVEYVAKSDAQVTCTLHSAKKLAGNELGQFHLYLVLE